MPILRPVSSACSRVAYGPSTTRCASSLRVGASTEAGKPAAAQLLGELVGPGRVLRAAHLEVDRRRGPGRCRRRPAPRESAGDVALDLPRRAPRERQPLVGGAVLHASGLREALGAKVERRRRPCPAGRAGCWATRRPAGRRPTRRPRRPANRPLADVDHPDRVALGRAGPAATGRSDRREATAAGPGRSIARQLLAAVAVEHQQLVVVLRDVQPVAGRREQHRTRVPGDVDRARRSLALGLVDDDRGVGGRPRRGRRRSSAAMSSDGSVVETGAWSEPSTSSTGALSPTRASSAPVMVAYSSCGDALQLRAEPDRGPAHHLGHGAAGVDGVERAVGTQRGRADLLEVGADPPGLEVERDQVALAVEREDQRPARGRRRRCARPAGSWSSAFHELGSRDGTR